MKDFKIPDGRENRERVLLIARMSEPARREDERQRNIGVGVRRGIQREHLAFPFPGEELVRTDLQMRLRPTPDLLERRAIVRPHGTEHRVALTFGGRHALLIETDYPPVPNIGLPIEAPEGREFILLSNQPVAGRRPWLGVYRSSKREQQA